VLRPAGLLIFDLHAGGPPRQVMFPSDVPFAPFDMSPMPGGGVWILDRAHQRYWALDRHFNVMRADQAEAVIAAEPVADELPRRITGNPASGADGAIWFFDRQFPAPNVSSAWKLGRIDIYGQFSAFDLGISGDSLAGLVSGGDGNLWFCETNGSIARSTITGQVTEFQVSSGFGSGCSITKGSDGALWFIDNGRHGVGRISTGGTASFFPFNNMGQLWQIVSGPDGALWITEPQSGKIARLDTSGVSAARPGRSRV